MILNLEAIKGTEAYTNAVNELVLLGRKREFIGCRYRWSELKAFSMYLNDFSAELAAESGEYIDAVLRPFNEIELQFIYDIKRALKEDDQAALDRLYQEHHTNIARVKRVVNKHTGLITRITNSIGDNNNE